MRRTDADSDRRDERAAERERRRQQQRGKSRHSRNDALRLRPPNRLSFE